MNKALVKLYFFVTKLNEFYQFINQIIRMGILKTSNL